MRTVKITKRTIEDSDYICENCGADLDFDFIFLAEVKTTESTVGYGPFCSKSCTTSFTKQNEYTPIEEDLEF